MSVCKNGSWYIYWLTCFMQSFFSHPAKSCRTWPRCTHFSLCRRERRSSLPPSPRSGSRRRRSGPAAAGEAGSPTTAAGPAPPPSTCWSPRTQTATGKRALRRAARTTIKRRRRKRTRLPAPRVRPGWRMWDGLHPSLSEFSVRTRPRGESWLRVWSGFCAAFCLHPDPAREDCLLGCGKAGDAVCGQVGCHCPFSILLGRGITCFKPVAVLGIVMVGRTHAHSQRVFYCWGCPFIL